jgi:hypothetical protein
MDPFLSVVASAFPGRAVISFFKGQAKPEGCYPNRPAGGTRGGPGNHTTAVEKACSPQIIRTVGHPWPSSFSMKIKFLSPKAFSFPLPSSSLSFNGWGKHSQPLKNIPPKKKIKIGRFEHRLKHDLKVLATTCVRYKIWKAAGLTKQKEGAFLCCTEKKDLREERPLLGFLLPRPPSPGPR